MRDFTLPFYRQYLTAIKASYPHILRFDEFFSISPKPKSFAIIRHDVDRCPEKALRMALLENEMHIRSTYYFRAKPHTFKMKIIKNICSMGHEIGYHYESLSDTKGNMELALNDFEKNLNRFRHIVPIKTVSMHGRPFSPFDNRDMWRNRGNHMLLKEKFKIFGEIYLDIDYEKIAYINDTGRNWTTSSSNKRDKVQSKINADFTNGADLYNSLKTCKYPQIIFQIHPERWSNNQIEFYFQWCKDSILNGIKLFI